MFEPGAVSPVTQVKLMRKAASNVAARIGPETSGPEAVLVLRVLLAVRQDLGRVSRALAERMEAERIGLAPRPPIDYLGMGGWPAVRAAGIAG
jgi:hypothetical protein